MPHTPIRRALHFGAGNIGRGLVGPLLVKSGFTVIFADVNDQIINLLHAANHYSVEILSDVHITDVIQNVDGVLSSHEAITRLLSLKPGEGEIPLVTTSVGPNVLPRIAPCIAEGLVKRMNVRGGILNVIACENMIGGSQALKREVVDCLRKLYSCSPIELDEILLWVEQNVGWPNCAVDRIVPPFDAPLGASQLDIGVEPFFEWAIDSNQLKGDSFHVEGAKLVRNLPAYLERKLYTLNCAHASLAYLGFIKGYTTLDEAMADDELCAIVHNELLETGSALVRRHSFDPTSHQAYIEIIMNRFKNPTLKDELTRIGRQPLRKLNPKERLVAPVNMLRGYGLERKNLLIAIAAALCYDVIDDEESVELQKRIREKGVELTLREVTGWTSCTDYQVSEDVKFVLEKYSE